MMKQCVLWLTGGWNLQSPSVMPLGSNPLQPIRCCLVKGSRLWVGYWNRVHVVNTDSKKVEQTFLVSERSEQQVRFLCAGGSGVWTSCRLDPILRLFDWSTGRPLQEVDFTALVTKTLGPELYLFFYPLQTYFKCKHNTFTGAHVQCDYVLSLESAVLQYVSA